MVSDECFEEYGIINVSSIIENFEAQDLEIDVCDDSQIEICSHIMSEEAYNYSF